MAKDTETARSAAKAMASYDRDELKRSLVSEGAYHVVVEGGYHTEALSDAEADFLTELIVEQGIDGLFSYANAADREGDRRDIAHITPLVSTSGSAVEELVNRLDDGNEYPGFFLDYNQERATYTLYEEGYGSEWVTPSR